MNPGFFPVLIMFMCPYGPIEAMYGCLDVTIGHRDHATGVQLRGAHGHADSRRCTGDGTRTRTRARHAVQLQQGNGTTGTWRALYMLQRYAGWR
jgi:hypothetical protein